MTQTVEKSAAAKSSPILRAQGIVRRFKMGDSVIVILKGLDLAVRAGEFLAIEGRSGSGKSTLLHLMGALDAADEGSIEYNGRDIAQMSAAQRSKLRYTDFGFVFQFYHLLPELNVLENTMLGPMIENSWLSFRAKRSQIRERAETVLKQMGVEHRLKHKPATLSGGERQRVAIARALMSQPKVLFADEPTGNLDAETGKQIMSVFEELHREHKQTVVMVTHDRTLARRADRVLILRDGKIERAADVAHE
jgi:lipoprotein-releasing system ATP-binding protein